MNKTLSINLGGSFFNIDDDAYQKLHHYLEAIRNSITDARGRDEILNDIEMRIAELISEKHNGKQIISTADVDFVISIMGEPEAYRTEDDASTANTSAQKSKKLYRDTNKGMVGGVCSGLSYYLGVDVVWLRIVLLVMILGFGTGILAYLILWIAIPAAKTTAEKIEMTGEPVTISSIEKKVRAEFDHVTTRLKNADYQKMENYAKTGAERVLSGLEEVLTIIVKAIAKFIGLMLIFISSVAIIVLLVGFINTQFISIGQLPLDALNYTNQPIWLLTIIIVLSIGLPLLALLLLGIKLLAPQSRSLGTKLRYSLIGLWILAVFFLIFLALKQVAQVAHSAKSITKETINCAVGDTLSLQMRFNDFYAKSASKNDEGYFTLNEKGKQVYYSNAVSVEVLQTDGVLPYLQIVKHANGKTVTDAKSFAQKLSYQYTISNNNIYLDNYFTAAAQDKYRDQHISVLLYLPKGMYFKPDQHLKDFNASSESFFKLHTDSSHLYFVTDQELSCASCQKVLTRNESQTNGTTKEITLELDKSGKLIEIKKTTN